MKNLKYAISIWLSLIVISITAQVKKDSTVLNILQFRERETNKIIDYKVTVIPIGNDSNSRIIDRTSNKINLAKGQYVVIIETLPLSKFKIDINTEKVYEIQIIKQGRVKFTCTKTGTIVIYGTRSYFKDKILTEFNLGEDEEMEKELMPGLYEVVRKANNCKDIKRKFMVNSNQLISIKL